MKFIAPVARVLLGLTFVVFSLNYFRPFLPQPPGAMPPLAMALAGALMSSRLMTLIKSVELVAGLALLANRFVPLALALLAPIVVGIVYFHVALAPAGAGISVFVLALELVLAWSYRGVFTPMLARNAKPDPVAPRVSAAPAAAH